MRNGDLNGLNVEFLGEINGSADALAAFPGKAENKVAMDDQPQLPGVFCELARPLHGCAFLNVLENLWIAGLIANNQQAASSFALRFQSLIVGSHA